MSAESRAIHTPKVAIVIPILNKLEDTLECLDSLEKNDYPAFEIIIVDNGSTDGSPQIIHSKYPSVRIVENGENLGFAEGSNRGIEFAMTNGAEVVFLLNNDTTVAPDCLLNLARAAGELPENSVLGAKILYYSDPDKIWHFGTLWDKKRFKLNIVAENEPGGAWTERVEVDHIIGCAMWIPCEVIRKIGMFDPRFFLNYEETDWCFRAKTSGIHFFSIPDAHIRHKVGTSFETNAHLMYFCERNRLLWIEKNFSGPEKWKFIIKREIPDKLKILMKIVRRSLECVLYYCIRARDRLNYKRYKLRATCASVLGWIHYFQRRFGDCPGKIRKPFVPSVRVKDVPKTVPAAPKKF